MPRSKKIYFCGSIGAGRQDAGLYHRVIQQLNEYGTVLTHHVGDENPEACEVGMTDIEVHDRDVNWLYESDVVVAECTHVSHGVGYELGRAVALNKKILVLFRPDSGKRLSKMLRGAENGTSYIVKDYTEEDLPGILRDFLGKKTAQRGV